MRPGSMAAVAAALNILAPGAGHLFLGRAGRFFIPLVTAALVIFGLGHLGLISTLPGFAVVVSLALFLRIFAILDAAVLPFRSGPVERKWYMRWFVWVAWIVASSAMTFLLTQGRESILGFTAYRIPGAYMRPTLSPGDIVLVDTRMPAGELPPDTPVVFRHPDSGALHILRVKQQVDSDTYSLSTGLPFAASLDVPRASISGMVTSVVWSPERREFGRAIK